MFDVSHMGQGSLFGAGAAAALERLVPGDMAGLKPQRQRYTLLTTEQGGILDDLMVANLGNDRLFLVVNASRKDVDFPHIAAALPAGIRLERHEDRALLALQGPAAAAVLQRLAPEAAALPFMGVGAVAIAGADCLVSRSGYTGEDGFEISVPAAQAEILARALLAEPEVMPAGLGARDSLRLEAGLCLYGNDIDETTNPIEAALTWVIGKRRRTEWNFTGAGPIRAMLENGPERLRVGIRPDGRAPARDGTGILDARRPDRRRHHLRRLRPHPRRPGRHGLCAARLGHRRHEARIAGARQAARRHRRPHPLRPPPLYPLKDPPHVRDTLHQRP